MQPLPHGLCEHVPLAPRCTLELGGEARWFIEVADEGALRDAIAWARSAGMRWFVLGGGSNVVVSDAGFDGLVVHVASRGIEAVRVGDEVHVRAAAGEPWDPLVAHTVAQGWTGLEGLSGIPGRVGATPIQNVGAYGCEVADTIVSVRVFDPVIAQCMEVEPATCEFGYRDSAFKHAENKLSRCVVTAVTFALRPGGAPAVKYPELSRALAGRGVVTPGAADVRACVLALRREKSMVLDASDENRRSAGSFFTNTVLSRDEANEVFARALRAGVVPRVEDVPRFDGGGGRVKIPSAWLIERAGFRKGERFGAVGISSRHALALVHHGGGTTDALLEAAERIRARVREVFGVTLVMEPVWVV